MAAKSQIQIAIEKTEAEIAVLQTVLNRLKEAQRSDPKRKSRAARSGPAQVADRKPAVGE